MTAKVSADSADGGEQQPRSVSLPPLPRERSLQRDLITDAAYRLDAGDHFIDVIVRFRLRSPDGPVRVPATPGARWTGPTMARPIEWILAYDIMDRPEKAAALRRLVA